MLKKPLSITIGMIMIILNAMVWLVLGIIIALNIHPGLPDMPGMKTALAIIAFIIAVILFILTYFLMQHNRAAYYLTLAFFIFTSILTVFDEVGWADIAFLFICLVPPILMIKDRKWYIRAVPEA